MTNTTLSGNTSKTNGGGLFNSSGEAALNNVTLSANIADSDANGTGNGGGVFRNGGTVSVVNTIMAGNFDQSPTTKHPDCSGALTSQGYNLLQIPNGCTINGITTGNLIGINPLLGGLADNGGNTFTHALVEGSPAVDAGDPATPGSVGTACQVDDQRGMVRPQRFACDIGAFELVGPNDPAQTGPIFTVNTALDVDDGVCSLAHCSLREAILAANARPNDSSPNPTDSIIFSLPGSGPYTLGIASALPEISDPLTMDGSALAGGPITLDGSAAGMGVNGLVISGGGSVVSGYTIQNFSGDGIPCLSGGNRSPITRSA
jgi:CSLREA domain-containing protein